MVTKSLIQRKELYSGKEDDKYLEDLKQIVFDEVIQRIEKNMDINAADILDAARVKLQHIKEKF